MATPAVAFVAVLCLWCDAAVAARWAVNEYGNCVHEWTPSSMTRGPLAMVNALTFPGRQLVGGGQAGYDAPSRSTGERVLLTPTLALIGLGTGAIESIFVVGRGLADVLTLGAHDLLPDESAELSLAPMTPRFLEGAKATPATDPCGRPR